MNAPPTFKYEICKFIFLFCRSGRLKLTFIEYFRQEKNRYNSPFSISFRGHCWWIWTWFGYWHCFAETIGFPIRVTSNACPVEPFAQPIRQFQSGIVGFGRFVRFVDAVIDFDVVYVVIVAAASVVGAAMANEAMAMTIIITMNNFILNFFSSLPSCTMNRF